MIWQIRAGLREVPVDVHSIALKDEAASTDITAADCTL